MVYTEGLVIEMKSLNMSHQINGNKTNFCQIAPLPSKVSLASVLLCTSILLLSVRGVSNPKYLCSSEKGLGFH